MAILGAGLVSPIGLDPVQHAAFPRAGLGLDPPSAFARGGDETVPVRHCPFLGARMPVADRLAALGERAIRGAMDPLGDVSPEASALLLCLGAPRPGLTEADRAHAARSLSAAARVPVHRVLAGAASFFDALDEASRLLASGEIHAALVAAVDSFVSLEAIRAEVDVPPPTWVRGPPPPGEGAAAVVLGRGGGVPALGTVHFAGARRGQGADDDDAIVDGHALAALLDAVPEDVGPIARAYGQGAIDLLRQREWVLASARRAPRFHARSGSACVEVWTGRLGAAAGAANLVHGLAAERFHAAREHEAGPGPLLAWAISPDGTRGLCAASAEGP